MNIKPNSRDGDFFRCRGIIHTDIKALLMLVNGGRNDLLVQHRLEMFFMHGFTLNKDFAKKPDRKKVTVDDGHGKQFTFERIGQIGRLDHPLHEEYQNQMHYE